ncbi:hypothetical protein SLE2022_319900 [Rubroshorea leprosula]
MIEAERLLLAGALEDPANQRFVLLSDSFNYTYKYLMASPRSYVDNILNVKDVIDIILVQIVQKLQKQHNRIPDEHYLQTHCLQEMSELEGALERRTLTYTLWNQAATKIENNWHPVTFSYEDADPKWINEIKAINRVSNESEFRTELMRENSVLCND